MAISPQKRMVSAGIISFLSELTKMCDVYFTLIPAGKISTIFYAIIGIPLMLLCLSNIGDIMASSFR